MAGHLLSASDDMTVCLWDVQAATAQSNYLDAKTVRFSIFLPNRSSFIHFVLFFSRFTSIVFAGFRWHRLHSSLMPFHWVLKLFSDQKIGLSDQRDVFLLIFE